MGKNKNPNFDPSCFRDQPPSHHLHEYPVVCLYSLCMRASVGGLLTWVGLCARTRRSLLSRLSAREVAGKLSGPAHDIPLLQRKYSLGLYHVVKLVAFLPARALVSLLSLCGRRHSRRYFLFLFLVPSPPLPTPLHVSLSPQHTQTLNSGLPDSRIGSLSLSLSLQSTCRHRRNPCLIRQKPLPPATAPAHNHKSRSLLDFQFSCDFFLTYPLCYNIQPTDVAQFCTSSFVNLTSPGASRNRQMVPLPPLAISRRDASRYPQPVRGRRFIPGVAPPLSISSAHNSTDRWSVTVSYVS